MDIKNTKAPKQKKVASSIAGRAMTHREKQVIKLMFVFFCCFVGLFSKRLINPLANLITDNLHIPGGISTSFSLMFMVIAVGVTRKKWCAVPMAIAQCTAAFMIGMIGSMGAFLPVAYIVPALVIDIIMLLPGKEMHSYVLKLFAANILSSVSAAMTANFLVFHLPKMILLVYVCVAATSGAVCGYIAAEVSVRINKNEAFYDKED